MTQLPELLGQLEDEWGRRDVPVELLRPGLSRDEIESTIDTIPGPLEPPEELIEWFMWHDGANMLETEFVMLDHMPIFPSVAEMLPLKVSARSATYFLDTFTELNSKTQTFIGPDQGTQNFDKWSHKWTYCETHLPILSTMQRLHLSVACVGGNVAKMYAIDNNDGLYDNPFDSLADMVRCLQNAYHNEELTHETLGPSVKAATFIPFSVGAVRLGDMETASYQYWLYE